MQNGNRVLARMQARVLSEKEMQSVSGGSHTATKCTVLADKFADGDTGEC
ncbi:MAG: bacteriocin [Actinomycetota bacterium]